MAADPTNRSAQDEAARAGWLYYVGGMTQDQIAKELDVSRQRAQRLVSRAMTDGLVHVRLNHRISSCIELEKELKQKFELKVCRVAPAIPGPNNQIASVAPFAAVEMVRHLQSETSLNIGLGTGRTLRAVIDELPIMECEHHKLVSLIGNIAPDGSASFYDVIMRIADRVRAPHFPMPIPVISASPEDREQFMKLQAVKNVMDIAAQAHVVFVGIGQMDETAPLLMDGFITPEELKDMQDNGAAGEVASWSFDDDGKYIDSGVNKRVCGVRVEPNPDCLSVGIVASATKLRATKAALKGKILNGLVLDENTAKALISGV